MSAQSSSATRRKTTAVEPDELVPSRYAQKVGAIDVLVVSDGVLPIPAQTIAHNIGLHMFAFRGKADIGFCTAYVGF